MDLDRRRLLTWTGLGGASVLLAACGKGENQGQGPIAGEKPQNSAPEPAASGVNDVNVLNGALDLEYTAVAAYTAAIAALSGDNQRQARRFRDHERQHVERLISAIKDLGGRPSPRPSRVDLPRLRDEQAVLRYASQLENKAIAAYIDAVPKLNEPALRAGVASILANEAEHLGALNQALDIRTAPEPFVTGEQAA